MVKDGITAKDKFVMLPEGNIPKPVKKWLLPSEGGKISRYHQL